MDIEDVLGRVPAPDLNYGAHLVGLLFQIGPAKAEAPLAEQDLEAWERRRGIDLAPWHADLLVEMSRAYLAEMHTARDKSAISPWPKARTMWKYVCDHRKAPVKEPAPDGHRKRRRDPTPG